MNLRLSRRRSTSSSRSASPAGPGSLGSRYSPDAPCRWRQQLAADEVEIGEREQAEGARQVLGDAAIADLGKPPQPLHHVERVLAAVPGPRPGPNDLAPTRGKMAVPV